MVITPRLDLRQSQSLVMTPQLQQAIKLLQLSNLELREYVEEELEENPLLERAEAGDNAAEGPEGPEGPDGGEVDAGEAPEGEGLEAVDFSDPDRDAEAHANDMDVEIDNDWNTEEVSDADIAAASMSEQAFSDWGAGGGSGADIGGIGANLEEMMPDHVSLRDHLTSQMAMTLMDPVERMIGAQLIDMLNDFGYVTGDRKQIADGLDCDMGQVREVLSKLQKLDPPGIFARDLGECLALQLQERDRYDPAMQALIDNLDLLAKREIGALVKVCGVDEEDIIDMVEEIRELNPKPADAFDDVLTQPVIPDVTMRPQPGGGWIVELNAQTLPRVLVNNTYFARISKATSNKADRNYINECHQSANWLVKSLHQRATTILKVASELVRQQDAFFAHGVQHLRPLVLRDIADAIDMHESTVSRVTSNKYVSTPRGIFELKYFFSAALGSKSGGDTHSAEAVRHRIKEMINAESPDKILSDDKIVTFLNDAGIDIARRTVAKYREALGLPSSVQRRREKRSAL